MTILRVRIDKSEKTRAELAALAETERVILFVIKAGETVSGR